MTAKKMLQVMKRISKTAKLSILDKSGKARSTIYSTRTKAGDEFAFTAEPIRGNQNGHQNLTIAHMTAALNYIISVAGPGAFVLWYDQPLTIEMAGSGYYNLKGVDTSMNDVVPQLDKEQAKIASSLKKWWGRSKTDAANVIDLALSLKVKQEVGLRLSDIGMDNPLAGMRAVGKKNVGAINDAFAGMIENCEPGKVDTLMKVIVASCDRDSRTRLFMSLH